VSRNVAALVLAAGQSTRLGQPKQLLPVSGRPLLERTLDVVRATSLAPRLLVLGAFAEQIRADVDTRGFEVVVNPAYASGQAGSLRAGLAHLSDDVEGVVALVGDRPLVMPWHVDALVERFEPGRHAAVVLRYADGSRNPVLLARELFPRLATLEGDVGAREFLRHYHDRVVEIAITDRPAPRDVDTLDDYEALLLDWASLGAPDVPRFCQRCAAEVGLVERYGRLRPVCPQCNLTHFSDPKVVAAVVVEIDGKIVLQRRAIDPGMGLWTFPGGFVDRGELLPEAAAREVAEEVGLHVEPDDLELLGVYTLRGDWVVLVAYRARADGQSPTRGDESSDVRLFAPDDVPSLAFARDPLILAEWRRRRR
jgi:molybdenum cofactor cytidylyltransferase